MKENHTKMKDDGKSLPPSEKIPRPSEQKNVESKEVAKEKVLSPHHVEINMPKNYEAQKKVELKEAAKEKVPHRILKSCKRTMAVISLLCLCSCARPITKQVVDQDCPD